MEDLKTYPAKIVIKNKIARIILFIFDKISKSLYIN